jgi:serine/threonine-protein kinase
MGKLFTITEGLENMGALKTGGQGSVYKGRRTGSIITAVKILPTPIHSESADDKNFADFQNEVRKLKKVAEQPSPNVVKILSSGITETGNLPFIEMEFIEGPDLEELIKPPHDPVFTIKETVKVAEQLARALAHCHSIGIRHGDIKSNNVKLNSHTGNYVLIDFGLAVMSDEQRRTSLRHAGAVEFMAPEQTEGRLLFETDVYAFGIVLYELLTGTVPFPLRDGSEMARNRVMVAHMETPPPDILNKRRDALPQSWSAEKKAREIGVPPWLLNTIYKCLQKAPENRFATGTALHDFLTANSTATPERRESASDRSRLLQQENDALRSEVASLKKQVGQFQNAAGSAAREIAALKNTIGNREAELDRLRKSQQASHEAPLRVTGRKTSSKIPIIALLVMACIGAFAAASFFRNRNPERTESNTASTDRVAEQQAIPVPEREVIQNRNLGQFKVRAEKAYFHNEPDENTRRNAYLLPSGEATINAWEERNNFFYTEFTNSRGQTSKGWLRKSDLMTLDEWEQSRAVEESNVTTRLEEARALLRRNETNAAVSIYKPLAEAGVPEALYEYGNLALQDKYDALGCEDAIRLLKSASSKGYTPAKRTLGFLYLFAENAQVLQVSNYDRCPHEKNIARGSKLLMEAVLSGDTAAGKWLEQHRSEGEEQ